jgi:F420-dependent oxidoreductase-like protein
MKLASALSYSGDPKAAADKARRLEQAGIDMLWVAELYSFDAVSILGYLSAVTETVELAAGILPLYSRTPTLTAMTAAGLDAVSGGRFVLGLGTSGPQVIEGWHGLPFDKPLARTRETIEICRLVWSREKLVYDGRAFQLPLPPEQGTGLGKPLKLINRPVRAEIPVYVASMGPKNVQLTAELADGWLPFFVEPEKLDAVWGSDLAAGAAGRDPSRGTLEVVAPVLTAICDDPDEAARIRDLSRGTTALYVGGMGAKGQNYYNDIFCRLGYEREAEVIQDLFLAGRRDEAAAAVPDEFLRNTTLVGDAAYVADRLDVYRDCGVTQLNLSVAGPNALADIARIKELVS